MGGADAWARYVGFDAGETRSIVGLCRVQGGVGAGSADPGVGVQGHQWIDRGRRSGAGRRWGIAEVWFGRLAPGLAGRSRDEFVGASGDPEDSAAFDLVAHGIGERLDRRVARDEVAVVVEQGVEGAERQRPVAAEDRSAASTEVPAPESVGLRVGWGQRELRCIGWYPSGSVGSPWPEVVAQLVEFVEQFDAPIRQEGEIPVGARQLCHQLVTAGLQPDAPLVRHALDPSERLDPGPSGVAP